MARQVPMTIAGAVAMLSLFVTVFLQRRAAHQLEIDLLLAKMGQHQRMEQLLTHEGDAIKSKLSLVKGSLRLREFEKSRQLEHDESRRRAAKERRVLVVYYVTGEKDVSKLQAFFELGFFPKMDDVEWVFVTSDADFDLPGLDDLNNVQLVSHKQEKRLNKDDMCCAWKTGVASQAKTFNYFIFLSSLSIGPFTPTYVPEDWVTTLIKTLTEKQNLLGPMVDCGEDTGSISVRSVSALPDQPQFDVPFLITDKAGVSVLEKSFCSKKSSAQEEASRIVERFGDAGHRVGNLVLRWSSLDLANSTAVRRNLAPVHSSQVASACDAFRSLKEEVPLHPFEAMFVDAESESGKIGQKLHAALEKKGVMEDDRQWDNPWDAFEDELLGLNTN